MRWEDVEGEGGGQEEHNEDRGGEVILPFYSVLNK